MIRWGAPGPYEVVFSTRVGGVSEGPFESLNLGRMTGDEPERVDENRRLLCDYAGADVDKLAMNFQLHSTRMNRAEAGVRGTPGDGLWTDVPHVPLLALSADCLPIALMRANGERPAVAVLHAGWKGLLDGLAASAVHALGGGLVSAVIGPAIGPCCYEVRDDVGDPFRARFGRDIVRDGKLDLWRAAELALRNVGVGRVERVDLCTACHPELFFSYRRDGKPRGGQGVLAYVA